MARLPRRTHPTIAALRACSWLPATHPLFRAALATVRDMITATGSTSAGLAGALHTTPRSALRIASTYGISLRAVPQCVRCGASLATVRSSAIHCSRRCRSAAAKQRQRQKERS